MKNKLVYAAALVTMLVGFSAYAQSTWDFSFSDSSGHTVDGVFTLNGSSGSGLAATNLNITLYSGITLYENSSYNWAPAASPNSFTVAGGSITYASFVSSAPYDLVVLTTPVTDSYSYLDHMNSTFVVATSDVVYTVAPVPEPTTLALAGLSGLSLLLFRKRK